MNGVWFLYSSTRHLTSYHCVWAIGKRSILPLPSPQGQTAEGS